MHTDEIPQEAAEAIERVRQLVRRMAVQVEGHGIERVDVTLGVAYGLHDLASQLVGHPIGAVEWLRTCVDMFERGHMSGGIVAFPKGGGGHGKH